MTLSRSKASIVSGSLREGLKAIVRWKEPELVVEVYHWSETCCGARGGRACVRMREEGRGRGEGRGSEERWTHLGVEDGGQVDARHEEVVAHVVLPLDALRRAQVGRDGDRGRARDVAGRHERARVSYEVDRQSDGE